MHTDCELLSYFTLLLQMLSQTVHNCSVRLNGRLLHHRFPKIVVFHQHEYNIYILPRLNNYIYTCTINLPRSRKLIISSDHCTANNTRPAYNFFQKVGTILDEWE